MFVLKIFHPFWERWHAEFHKVCYCAPFYFYSSSTNSLKHYLKWVATAKPITSKPAYGTNTNWTVQQEDSKTSLSQRECYQTSRKQHSSVWGNLQATLMKNPLTVVNASVIWYSLRAVIQTRLKMTAIGRVKWWLFYLVINEEASRIITRTRLRWTHTLGT